MNRRQMLTNTVSGIGALAAVGMNASTVPGCDNEKAKGKKEDSKDPTIKSAGQVCPIYPCMFYGSYTMYYGMVSNGTTCSMPKALNGPNSLPLGCEMGGCATAFDGKVALKGGHPQTRRLGCGRRAPTAHADADGVDRIEMDDIRIRCSNPADPRGPKIRINVRLYRVMVTPKNFDMSQLSDASKILLNGIAGQSKLCFGHEIDTTPLPPPAETFGTIEGDVVSDPGSHVLVVKMTDESEPFEVVIVQRTP